MTGLTSCMRDIHYSWNAIPLKESTHAVRSIYVIYPQYNKDMNTPQTLAESLQPSDPINELQSHYLGVLYGDCNRTQFIPYFIKELGRLLGINHMPQHSTTEDSLCFTVHGWHVSVSMTDCVLFTLKNEQGTISCNNVSELINTLNTVYF